MTRKEVESNIGATVTLNGFGDLGMEPAYRRYINDCIGNYPLIIKKLTKSGMAHLYDVEGSSNIMGRKFMSVPPKNVDLIMTADKPFESSTRTHAICSEIAKLRNDAFSTARLQMASMAIIDPINPLTPSMLSELSEIMTEAVNEIDRLRVELIKCRLQEGSNG